MQEEDDDAVWAAEVAAEAADRERKAEPPPLLTEAEFLAWRSPRSVSENPTVLDNPLWHWLVRTRWDGFNANNTFHGPSPFDAGPMWCFARFGKSETPLPDGRVIHIGGEHEDHYDPDFHIYNDVTVIGPDGSIAIHGYPESAFPPTDFHSATLVGDSVVIVGCLGNPEQRIEGVTPVFRLALDTLRITRVETHGEAPGWIHGHSATLEEDKRTIVLTGGQVWRGEALSLQENIDAWALDAITGRWERRSQLDWQRWTMLRIDRKRSRLWDVRQELWHREHASLGLTSYWRYDDEPDFEALSALYRLDDSPPPVKDDQAYNVFRTVIDGIPIRFTEEGFEVHAIVEGRLFPARLNELKRRTLDLLERLEASPWEIEV
jgi:hypothetical protein